MLIAPNITHLSFSALYMYFSFFLKLRIEREMIRLAELSAREMLLTELPIVLSPIASSR